MYFEDFASLIAMDGHGFYVWSTYAIGLAVIGWNLFAPLMTKKRLLQQIKRQSQNDKRARQASANRAEAVS